MHSASNTIVSLSLQSTICVNYSRITSKSRKCWVTSLLYFFSPRIESPSSFGRTTSTGFMLMKNPILCCKKAGNKWKTVVGEVVREVARDGIQNPLIYSLLH